MSVDWWLFGELVPLAMVIALSPLSIVAAVVLVLHSPRPRPTGLAFLLGWLVGLTTLTVVFDAVPRVIGPLDRTPPTWTHWVGIVVGVALLAAGLWRWLTRKTAATPSGGWVGRVKGVTPAATAFLGLVLPVLNVKVLLMCAGAGLAIGTADLSVAGSWIAVAFFTVLAASTVGVPILTYVAFTERLSAPVDRFKSWMQRNNAGLTAATLALIGVILLYASEKGS